LLKYTTALADRMEDFEIEFNKSNVEIESKSPMHQSASKKREDNILS
jgi:hypothetical protein